MTPRRLGRNQARSPAYILVSRLVEVADHTRTGIRT